MGAVTDRDRARAYWRRNVALVGSLLVVWFAASFGCGILFADDLDRHRIAGFKLGFWFAQQGAIYVFLLVIAAYVVLMNRLDRRYDVDERDGAGPPTDDPGGAP